MPDEHGAHARRSGPPPRRGPAVDLDPTGIVTGKSPDSQPRQFVNYAFYRLDPVFRRLPADEQRAAATEFSSSCGWESSEALILRTYSLVGLRADVDFMLWRFGSTPVDPVDGSGDQAVAAGRLPAAGAQLPVAPAPVALRQQDEGPRRRHRAAAGRGKYLFVYPFTKTRSWYRLSPHARQGMMDDTLPPPPPSRVSA